MQRRLGRLSPNARRLVKAAALTGLMLLLHEASASAYAQGRHGRAAVLLLGAAAAAMVVLRIAAVVLICRVMVSNRKSPQ